MNAVRFFILTLVIIILLNAISFAQGSSASPLSQISGPLTLQQLNLIMRRNVGRDMTENHLAALIERYGIDFNPTPEIVGRLRFNGAHPHLLNTIRRAGEKYAPTTDVVVTTKVITSDPIIEEVRQNVKNYVDEMPDFICTEEVERFVDREGSGGWSQYDTLRYELTYSKKGETMKPLNTTGLLAPPKSFSKGATSAGEFASTLAELFGEATHTIFTPAGKEKLGTHSALIYDYRVAQANSHLTVQIDTDPPFIAGYAGSIWIDADTKQVLRIEQAIENPPPQYRTFSGDKIIDYELVKLRGLEVEVLLPMKAEVMMLNRGQKSYSMNKISFKFYRKFESDIKFITGDEEKPAKPEKP